MVSTHSRAEAAACRHLLGINIRDCFNTQPRGGGCLSGGDLEPLFNRCFNTQPRGGGCDGTPIPKVKVISVSTHSRAEAAADLKKRGHNIISSFNTQPRGGGCKGSITFYGSLKCFNTQPRGGGCGTWLYCKCLVRRFQHTAARRRLRVKSLPA